MRSLRLAACIVIACGLGVIGCGSDNKKNTYPDGGPILDGGHLPDGGGPTQLTVAAFAKDLILNHSSDATPSTTEDKNLTDSQDSSLFPASFFP